MRRLLTILTSTILLGSLQFTNAVAQSYSTQGRDFWFRFIDNHWHPADNNKIYVASEQPATVMIAGSYVIATIDLPAHGFAQVLLDPSDTISYHITATNDITVYAEIHEFVSGMATIYPTSTLRSNYIIQTFEDDNYLFYETEQFAIVAVEDSTLISVNGPGGGFQEQFTLSAGESRLYGKNWKHGLHCRYFSGPFSGINITASNGKKIAVFQGSTSSVVCGDCNPSLFRAGIFYEQAMPTDYWGREFIVTPIDNNYADNVIQIISKEDYCRVWINDTLTTILNSGEHYNLWRNDVFHIRTQRPVSVCLYTTLQSEMVTIPPLERSIQHSTFYLCNFPQAYCNSLYYVNVVTPTCSVSGMLLDGQPIDTAFISFDSIYSYAQLHVSSGIHTLTNTTNLFNAWALGGCFGDDDDEDYPGNTHSYVIGMALTDSVITVNNDYRLLVDSTVASSDTFFCANDTVWFELNTENNYGNARWSLDDVQLENTSLRLPLYFDSAGTHTLKALLHGDCCQEWCDSLQITLHVMPSYRMYSEDFFCRGSTYRWQDTLLYEEGTYYDTLITANGCDSLLVLHLVDKYTPRFGLEQEADCYNHAYRLTVDKQDTIEWDYLRWSATPDDPMLHGHEHDTTVDVSPSRSTTYTLHIETPCPVDSSIRLEPIVWPVARVKVLPETVMLSERNSFDAYDLSQQATGRRWDVDGVTQTECGPHLHYTLNGQMDSVLVVLTAYNDYCIDTANAVVKVLATDIYAPNVFTPEADLNNRFAVIAYRPIEGELSIYNREGLLVFRTDDLAAGWNGLGCPQGAYVWHLRYRFDFEADHTSHTAVGTVTLLR